MTKLNTYRSRWLLGSAILAVSAATPFQAMAQDAGEEGGLEEIIVTAQKREQSVMDVPVAVSALSGDALESNRITNISDLSSIAPGVTVRVTAGGAQLASFTARGAVSYGVVPGSDRQISVYLDGVYISTPRGGVFELPDIQRVEMLRGPQGTLFGRNATAGAVSVSTRDPSGEAHIKVSTTLANQNGRRYQITADTPQIGPFSAFFSFVHTYRRGDIRNAKAGVVWNRSAALTHPSILTSAKWLGTKDNNSYFAGLKFESGAFTTVYKFDRYESGNRQTPEGTGFIGINAAAPLTGNLFTALVNSQTTPVHIAPNGRRPDVVDNAWIVPGEQKNQGHSLTSTLDLDNISIKNIAAYRKSYMFGVSPIDGFSTLTFTPQTVAPYATFIAFSRGMVNANTPPATIQQVVGQVAQGLLPLVGQPFGAIAAQTGGRNRQWSDELQINYTSDFLTLTAGAMIFKSKDWVNEHGMSNNIAFQAVPGGVLTLSPGIAYNKANSSAVYAQAELHVSPQLDVVLGGRYTHDKKTSSFTFGTIATPLNVSAVYKDSRPSYLIGLNYKPNDDMLVYLKYSTAYVSGGSTAGLDYKPEKARSAEGGVKAELFDRRLRTSLAVFWAKYTDYQSAQGATTFGAAVANLLAGKYPPATISALVPVLGTFVLAQGDVEAKGFEFDATAAPVDGVTLGGSLSYTDTKFSKIPTALLGSLGITDPKNYRGTFRPKWTGSLYGQYDSQPLVGDAYLSMRVDANYQSSMPIDANAVRGVAAFAGIRDVPSYWLVNGRLALKDIGIGPLKGELALWGKNLFDEDKASYGLINANVLASANYIPARSYGLDVTVEF